jgi:threonyl-tRNA synthetase
VNDKNDKQYPMRHSLAHILAAAVQNLWPETKFGVGPVIDNGFYYDVSIPDQIISEADFPSIETVMRKIIEADEPFNVFETSISEAIDWAKKYDQPFKLELLNDLKRSGTTALKDLDVNDIGVESSQKSKVEKVTFYRNGNFTDLCRGPHVKSTGKVGVFKLMRISGAYWRGDEKNTQMQRIYGVAFANDVDLKSHLELLEEAKRRDHRKLGTELDLFLVSPLVGSGLPLFTPRGTVLRDELNRFSQEIRKQQGWQNVWTPHIAKQELYEASGHWAKFGDEWLTIKSQETTDKLVMKPMNCPHHQQIYSFKQRSYKDLPIKYMETTTDYRDEKAGELLGLSRVRAITQDDSHTFCRPDQIQEVIRSLVDIVHEFYSVIGLPLKVRLSFKDETDGYLGDEKLWEQAQHTLKEIVESADLDYYIGEGEAAFYGPKIDFMATDALGRELQVATPQLDFVQPERFGLKYTDEDGKEKTPVMVHFALMGSIERFLSVYIEHCAGKFPVWLAPEQIRLATINQTARTITFANNIAERANKLGLRLTIDESNESVSKKIRNAEIMKVPFVVVIGDKEIETGELLPRIRKDLVVRDNHRSYTVDEVLKSIANDAKARVNKSSL